ncbi:glycosyltransferase [Microcoleus sp. S28C3]|uniref:glycosyltransferase n=1 Tax=Microcoleus sp. S28C3 TaxID=3055414 RepID=UPI002FD771DC
MSIKTSILIRTKNEAQDIAKTLRLVTSQSFKIDDIVVVDSGSTDETVNVVKQWSEVKLIQIQPEEFTFGRSLNIGLKATEAEIVIALSAHAFPCDRYWLQNLVKHFDDPEVAGVYGKQVPQPDAWPPVQRDLAFYGDQLRTQTNPDSPGEHFFSNANSAIRRQCWEKHCFDETLTGSEDWEWSRAMLRLGYKIIYEPQAAVYHSHNERLLKVYQRFYREALAFQSIYGEKMSLHQALRKWRRSVLADIRFILQNGKSYEWILRAPIYRLFWIYGLLKPSLAAPMWEPFVKRWLRDYSNKQLH